MPSRASEFYAQITEAQSPAQVLKNLVAERRAETEFLEFKGGGRIQERQVKDAWSKALSGFANTEGGVLVWGISSRRVPVDGQSRKIDVADELDLAKHPDSFCQLLKDVLLEACLEPAVGVQFAPIVSEQDGSGFVVCLIPEGKHKPYRASLEDKSQYWQRVGDNFVIIPHSLLRSLFYPTVTPLLCVSMWNYKHEDHRRVSAKLVNEGNATAREVFVRSKGRRVNWQPEWIVRKLGDLAAGLGLSVPLHPGESVPIGHLDYKPDAMVVGPGIEVRFEFFMADTPRQSIDVYISDDELLRGGERERRFTPAAN